MEGFIDKVKAWWLSYEVNGNQDFILTQKLKFLKKDLSIWNKEEIRKIQIKKNKASGSIMSIQQSTEGTPQTREEKLKLLSLQQEFQHMAKVEEVSWKQKFRCLWLQEGDRNTKFYQMAANSNRRTNYIDKLKVGTEIIEDKDQIKEEILSFYQQLYSESET